MTFFNDVYGLCKQIPKGKVSTYGELARKLNTKAYRLVGQALRNNFYVDVPCHRVLNSKGELYGFKGSKDIEELNEKKELLEQEGIVFNNGKVLNFEKILFKFK
jgi:methylated-DNA-[protein]-cysteine S-methyltransferase